MGSSMLLRQKGPGDMSDSEEYRVIAATCLHLTKRLTDPVAKKELLKMACAWHTLAEHSERHRKFFQALTLLTEPQITPQQQSPVEQSKDKPKL